MTSQNRKPTGLPNPYAGGGLPNPYAPKDAGAVPPSLLQEEQAKAEDKKPTAPKFHNPHLIKRPQAKAGNTVKKPTLAKPAMGAGAKPAPSSEGQAARQAQPDIDYWRNTVDDDNAILSAKREEDYRYRQAKKDQKKMTKQFGNWQPSSQYKDRTPTHVNAYQGYGEYDNKKSRFERYLSEARRLHNAQLNGDQNTTPQQGLGSTPDSAGSPVGEDMLVDSREDSNISSPQPVQADNSRMGSGELSHTSSPHPVQIDEGNAGEDAYQRRLRLSQQQQEAVHATEPMDIEPTETKPTAPQPAETVAPSGPSDAQRREEMNNKLRLAKERAARLAAAIPPPPPPPPQESIPPPPPPPPPAPYSATISAPPVRYSATISAPPVRYSATISAAPVHYARPDVEMKDADEDKSATSSKKQEPKEKKLTAAEKMMAKMGYKKGEGLGKNSDGITTHLEVKKRKEPKGGRPYTDEYEFDNEFGGAKAPKPQQVFDITGGAQARPKEQSKWGEPSRVVVAWGCVDGIDFEQDADRDDGGIRQEMGDTFDAKFGSVERIHVNMSGDPKAVYIAFRDALSALNAVNRFSEGYQFRGRDIRARFYDEAKFMDFDYEH